MKRIGFKLFLGYLCMAAVTIGLLWLIQAVFMKDSYLNRRVDGIVSALESTLGDAADYERIEASQNVSLLAVDATGNTVYMSNGMPMRGQLAKLIPDLIGQSPEEDVQYLQAESQDARYAMVSRKLSGDLLVLAVFSLADVNEASRLLLRQLWIVTAALAVMSVLLAVMLSRIFSRPIRQVTQAARLLAEGETDVLLPVKSKDEIGQLTQALNELGEELGKTESLRRELIANVSHELRSPLSVIQGFAETVRDVTWPDEGKRTGQLTMISEEAARLSHIVTDILDYSKIQSGVDAASIEAFPLRPVLADMADRFELAAVDKGLRIEFSCAEMEAHFDKGKLLQVMSNLISNAVNHAQSGTVVYIRAERLGNRAKISVINTGKPIPADELKQIWDRYHRVPRQGSNNLGTGLGLSIVKSILTLHGVPYGVSSDEKGTVFWFETVPADSIL